MIGKQLKTLRESHQKSQMEVCSALNIEQSTLANYENDKRVPKIDILIKIAEYYHVSVDYILGNSTFESKQERPPSQNTNIKYWIDKSGLGYDEISQNLGISESLLSDYMNGNINIPYQILISLSEICEVSTDCLLGLTEKSRKRDLDQVIPYRYNYRIAERIRKLCENNGVDINSSFFQDLLSLSEKEVFYLVEYGFIPHVDVIIKMADYFNVSTDYLLCKIEEQEEKALSSFHLLNSDNQDIIVGEIKKCIKEQKYEETVAADQPLRKAAGK